MGAAHRRRWTWRRGPRRLAHRSTRMVARACRSTSPTKPADQRDAVASQVGDLDGHPAAGLADRGTRRTAGKVERSSGRDRGPLGRSRRRRRPPPPAPPRGPRGSPAPGQRASTPACTRSRRKITTSGRASASSTVAWPRWLAGEREDGVGEGAARIRGSPVRRSMTVSKSDEMLPDSRAHRKRARARVQAARGRVRTRRSFDRRRSEGGGTWVLQREEVMGGRGRAQRLSDENEPTNSGASVRQHEAPATS